MRGNPRRLSGVSIRQGSIPAHAGEPCRCSQVYTSLWVYPRACGGTHSRPTVAVSARGLSPRMRGNREDRHSHSRGSGSIPAHAGEPLRSTLLRLYTGVYPRACGGTILCWCQTREFGGLSPRMRGNLLRISICIQRTGSIPAHAGEPARFRPPRYKSRVYPRACGGTSATRRSGTRPSGLSPRMRGNRTG